MSARAGALESAEAEARTTTVRRRAEMDTGNPPEVSFDLARRILNAGGAKSLHNR